MPHSLDRFLDRAPILEDGPSLGRVFVVVRETWLLDEDPRVVAPRTETSSGRRTALEAADLARARAEAFERHGFHKPSGAWWASDGVRIHRFAVRTTGRGRGRTMMGVVLAAGTAVAGWTTYRMFRAAGRRVRSRS